MLRLKILCALLAVPFLITGMASATHGAEIKGYTAGNDGPDGIAGNDDDVAEKLGDYSAKMISAQAFGDNRAAILLNLADATTGRTGIWIEFPRSVRYDFDLELHISGAEFSDAAVTAQGYTRNADGVLTIETAATCTNFPRNADRVVLSSCGNTNAETAAIIAVQITDLSVEKATSLATAGNTVTLTATLRDAATNDDVHTSAAAAIYRSVHSATALVNTEAALHVDPESSPAFSKIRHATGSTASGTIGYVNIAGNSGLLNISGTTAFTDDANGQVPGTNLIEVDTSAVVSSATVSVSHPAFADGAFKEVTFHGMKVPDSTATPPKSLTEKELSGISPL